MRHHICQNAESKNSYFALRHDSMNAILIGFLIAPLPSRHEDFFLPTKRKVFESAKKTICVLMFKYAIQVKLNKDFNGCL